MVTPVVSCGELEETPVRGKEERGKAKREKRWFASQA